MITVETLGAVGVPAKNARLLLRRLRRRSNGCWRYIGALRCGVPVWGVRTNKKFTNYIVHRLLHWAATGVKPPYRSVVTQKCGDKTCPNPDHLVCLSRVDYVKSMDKAVYRTKRLNWDMVHRIRKMPVGVTDAAIGREYGIARSTANAIRNNKAWQE